MAPVVGPLTSNGDNEVYLDEQDEHANKILAFRRLWCLVVREITPSLHLDIPIPIPHPFGSFLSYLVQEIFATIQASKGLIFRGAAVLQVTDRYVHLAGSRGGGGAEGEAKHITREMVLNMLSNCAEIIDVANAVCRVPADREREMATIENDPVVQAEGGLGFVNRTITSGLLAGEASLRARSPVVDNFTCGEIEALRMLPEDQVEGVLMVACSADQVKVLDALLSGPWRSQTLRLLADDAEALCAAAHNGSQRVVERLLGLDIRLDGIGTTVADEAFDCGLGVADEAEERGHSKVASVLRRGHQDRIDMGL